MSNYNFSTLNDKEFEDISKDLLNSKFSLELQSFRRGRDKGIDLRFSTSKKNNSIVVQVKHYLNSGYSQLKFKIINSELPKIGKLKCDRYILVTSIDLSVGQKDELKNILSPYVKSSNDIIGQNELNDYLSEFKEIEKKYYKLWLSSTTVIQTILNNAIESRTKYFLSQLENKIKYYVVTEKIAEANEILKREKILLITGQPGIGKTSLAEIILYDRAKNGFKIHKVENITEAEDIISYDNKEVQLFYFDDFLGANYSEIINSHKTETQLTSFTERIINTPNKYIIFTTRTIILNYATEKYEKISNSSLNNRHFELKLTDYTKYEKALILYNHLYHKEIDEKLYEVILNEKFYQEIINHKNYTPRIIEFITDSTKIKEFSGDQYHQFILNNLNNPKGIWNYSFNNQIETLDKCLLLTLFTFGNEINEVALQKAYESRLNYEKTNHNQIIGTDQFNHSIKILMNGFISSTIYNFDKSNYRSFKFINPSLADFLINYIAESFSERKSIISCITSIKQLNRFDPAKSIIPLEKELQTIIRDKFEKNEFEESKLSSNKINSDILITLTNYCRKVNTDKIIHLYITKINYEETWDYSTFLSIKKTIENLEDSPLSFNYIKDNFLLIIEKIIDSIDDEMYSTDIVNLFEKYEHDFQEYLNSSRGKLKISELIENIISYTEDSLKEGIKDEVEDFSKVEDIYSELNDIKDNLFYNLSIGNAINDNFLIEMDKDYWNEKIEENEIRNQEKEFNRYEYEYERKLDNKIDIEENLEQKIERLFD